MEFNGTKVEDRTSRITDTMLRLGDRFTLADLAAKLSMAKSTLRNDRWRQEIKHAADRLGLEFRRTGWISAASFMVTAIRVS